MGNYNFEDDEKEFNETVRLDTINEEVRKREELEQTAEFEPVDRKNDYEEPPIRGKKDGIFSNNMFKLSLIGGLIVFAFIFAAVFMSVSGLSTKRKEPANENNISEAVTQTDSIYAIVLNSDRKESISLYNINHKKKMTLKITEETTIYGGNGGEVNFAEFRPGDVVTVLEGKKGEAKEISVPHDIWRKDSIKGVEVDIKTNNIIYDGKLYAYGEDTYFVSDDVSVFPGDITSADTVTIIGKDNMVFSVRIETGHGTLLFKNLKDVEEIQVLIDDEPIEINKETGMAEVGSGTHKLTVKGSNIEEYITIVNIDKKGIVTVDLTQAAEAASNGLVKLKVDQSGYTVMVDGTNYTESTTDIVVAKGSHKIEILKTGFDKWSTAITVGEIPQELNVQLRQIGTEAPAESKSGSFTVYSDPGWAKVYIDGEYKGVSPIMVNLSYGEHYVEVELEGYDKYKTHVTIDSPDRTMTANFK